jgi:putative endonuclease
MGGRAIESRRQSLKRVGEEAAAQHLAANGYRILSRNYRTRLGEIDIIAEDAEGLAFVEVKCRTSDRFGRPSEAVTSRKMRTIDQVARRYLAEHGSYEGNWRFDLVEVLFRPGKPREIVVLKNVWSGDPQGGHFC